MNVNYTQEQRDFLERRKAFIDFLSGDGPFPDEVRLIQQGKGNFQGCLSNLETLHKEKAEYAWFANNHLSEFKLNCYVACKLKYIRCKQVGEEGLMWEGEYFYALLSEHEATIQWMINQPVSALTQQRISNPALNEYRYYQMTLALKGKWDELSQRAMLFLNDVPVKMKKYAVDQRFYLALAAADVAGMESALAEMTQPKLALKRNGNFDFAFSGNFISCFATLYVKIAKRHGYALKIKTSYIPAEWIPVSPLVEYPEPYDFMQNYNMVA